MILKLCKKKYKCKFASPVRVGVRYFSRHLANFVLRRRNAYARRLGQLQQGFFEVLDALFDVLYVFQRHVDGESVENRR